MVRQTKQKSTNYELEKSLLLWRACNLTTFTPCLTGPVDYPFASCHEGLGFKPQGGYLCEIRILLLALSRYIGDPDMIRSLVSLPFSGCFTKLRADNVKSQRLCRPSVGASLGFALTMCKLTWFHTALLSRFHTCCRSSFRLHNWRSRLLGGTLWRACNLTTFTPYLTGPVDYAFGSHHEGPGFKSRGGYLCETGILLLALSRYTLN